MGITRGIPVVAIKFKNEEIESVINVGDVIPAMTLTNGRVIENATLRGVELDLYNAASLTSHNYDTVSSYMYRNSECGLGNNTSNQFDVKTIVFELEDQSFLVVDLADIKDVLLYSEEDLEWLENVEAEMIIVMETYNDENMSVIVNEEDSTITIDYDILNEDSVAFIDELITLDGLTKLTWTLNHMTYEIGTEDADVYDTFKQNVLNTIQSTNTVQEGELIMANGTTELIYTLKVSYFNEAEVVAKINDNSYSSVNNALAAAVENDVIMLMKDTVEDVVVPDGKTVTLNLNGHNITNAAADTITNNGILTVTGTGVVDNITHGKAAVLNNKTCTLEGGTYQRSAEAGNASSNGGNSYYTILNHGEMTIGAGVTVANAGGWSSNISNGWYDSAGKSEADVCKLTIDGATVSGGKYNVKGDELGETVINSGNFVAANSVTLLNWHKMTINGGTFTNDDHAGVSNGTYGLGVGQLRVTDGVFDVPVAFNTIADYPSVDIVVTGGTYNSESAVDAAYIADTHKIALQEDGKYKVVEKSAAEAAEEEVDEIISGLSGVDITPDPEVENQFSIVTTDGSLSNSGLFESLAAIDGVTTITVSNGDENAVYNVSDGDMSTFKAAVDAMLPTKVDDPEVTLTMTIAFA